MSCLYISLLVGARVHETKTIKEIQLKPKNLFFVCSDFVVPQVIKAAFCCLCKR